MTVHDTQPGIRRLPRKPGRLDRAALARVRGGGGEGTGKTLAATLLANDLRQ